MKKRLIFGLSSILLLLLAGGMIVAWNLNRLTANQKKISAAMELHHDYLTIVSGIQTAQAELYKHQAGYVRDLSNFAAALEGVDYHILKIQEQTLDPKQKEAVRKIVSLIDEYKQALALLLKYRDRPEQTIKYERQISELGGHIRDELSGLYAVSEAEMASLAPAGAEIIDFSEKVVYVTLILSMITAILIAVAVIRRFTLSIDMLIEGTDAIIAGDFSRRMEVTSKDDLGMLLDRFNRMSDAISRRDEEIQSTLEELEASNEELQSSYSEMSSLSHELEESRRELEQDHRRLMEARAYLRNVFDYSPDAIITTDMNGRIVEFNMGAEAILGFKADEIAGKPAEILYPDRMERQRIIGIIKEKGKICNYETTLLRKNGSEIDVSLTISQLKDDRGYIIGTVGISRDISDIKKGRMELLSLNERLQETAAALEAARANLEKKVEERTRELSDANRKLVESNQKIKEADRLKSEFMANMSHELRTPLNAIIGFSELLLDGIGGEINEVQRMDLSHIHESGKHLLSIINDILDLSKIEAGRMELVREDVDINSVIGGVVAVIRPLMAGKKIKMKVSIDDELPLLMADGKRFKQIIFNLLSNAVKFTEEGEVSIEATLLEDGQISISVSDTGIGIREEDIPKVFEKFRQIDMSSTRNQGGTGLGMAITKRLVEMHGGVIEVESKVGVGSTFRLTLPVNCCTVLHE